LVQEDDAVFLEVLVLEYLAVWPARDRGYEAIIFLILVQAENVLVFKSILRPFSSIKQLRLAESSVQKFAQAT